MTEKALARNDAAAILERVVIGGNLAELKPEEKLMYYQAVCQSVGLNPLTRPFEYLQLSGRLVLYVKKEATEQLRKIHGVSITKLERETSDGIHTVTAYALDDKGRTDASTGSVSIEGLRGEAKANSKMKAETKAKRRVTLSICGLGVMDESEVEDALLADQLKDTQTKQPETVVVNEAAMEAPEAEEIRALIDEATRLSRAMNLTPAKKKAYMRDHLGGEDYDTLNNADPAALKAMIEAMKKDHGSKAS